MTPPNKQRGNREIEDRACEHADLPTTEITNDRNEPDGTCDAMNEFGTHEDEPDRDTTNEQALLQGTAPDRIL